MGLLKRMLVSALAGATIALATGGCSPPESSPATTAPARPSTTSPSPTEASASEPFEVVAGPFPDMALRSGVANDDEVAVYYRRASDEAVGVYRDGSWATWGVVPAATSGLDNGGIVQTIELSEIGPVFAVTEETGTLDYSLYFWRDGDAAPSLMEHTVSDFFWTEYAVTGSDLYLTRSRGDLSCIDRFDLAAANPLETGVEVVCADSGVWLFSPSIDEGTLVFMERPASAECTTDLHRVDLASGVETVVDSGPCAFVGLGTAGFSAWTQVPPDPSEPNAWSAAPLWVNVGGGAFQVDVAVANSPIVCGGALYYVGSGLATESLNRWEPDGEAVTVYGAPPTASVYIPSCAGGRVSWLLGDAEGTSLLTTAPLHWSAGVPSDAR